MMQLLIFQPVWSSCSIGKKMHEIAPIFYWKSNSLMCKTYNFLFQNRQMIERRSFTSYEIDACDMTNFIVM